MVGCVCKATIYMIVSLGICGNINILLFVMALLQLLPSILDPLSVYYCLSCSGPTNQ